MQIVLFQDRLVEFVPVVKIVQAHRIFLSGSVIGNAARTQNTLARRVIVIITADGSVMLFDRFPGSMTWRFALPTLRIRDTSASSA